MIRWCTFLAVFAGFLVLMFACYRHGVEAGLEKRSADERAPCQSGLAA